jgi:mannose-1-phosphate guanylyltransferase
MILCGGGGQRLWPLSREKKPKQFISFLQKGTLLEQTIKRIEPIAKDKNCIGIVTTKKQLDLVSQQTLQAIGCIIKEPIGRNTAPAVLYSLLLLEKTDKDAVVVFLPADSFVVESEKYQLYLSKAIEYSKREEKIVTLGVMPTRPAIGYGYIQADVCNSNLITAGQIYQVSQFHEKPDIEKAKKYMEQGNMFWNIAVFISKVSVFIDEFKQCAPKLYKQMLQFMNNEISYDAIVSVSVDYAVMEQSNRIAVLPCDFEWSDVGNLDVFLSLQHKLSMKREDLEIINVNSKKNLAHISLDKRYAKKAVVFLGVDNICLIEDDNVILVAKRDDVEKVKDVLQKLRKDSMEEFI